MTAVMESLCVPDKVSYKQNGLTKITHEVLHCFLYGKVSKLSGTELTREGRGTAAGVVCPAGLQLAPSTIPGQNQGVFTARSLQKGTKMGPYPGVRVSPSQLNGRKGAGEHMWEVYEQDGRLSHYVDGSDTLPHNWMVHVVCARSAREQNLQVVQVGMDIYYEAVQDVPLNTELLVWYGETYNCFFGIPDHLSVPTHVGLYGEEGDHSGLDSGRDKVTCLVCHKFFNSRSNLRSHMRTHTMEKPFTCQFCHRRFSQSSTLRNHIRLHTGEKPYRCDSCRRSYSQLAGLRAHQKSARHRQPAAQTPRHPVGAALHSRAIIPTA